MTSMAHSGDGYHHGDLRTALLKAGEQLLVKRGVAALSLREVAQQAGVSHAAPYRHFKGKAALMRALAESGFKRLHAAIERSAAQIPHDPERKLLAAALAYAELAQCNPELVQLMYGAGLESESSDDLQVAAQAPFTALLAIMHAGIEAGVFRKREPYELTVAAWTMMHGLALQIATGRAGLAGHDGGTQEERVRAMMRNLLYGISR